MPINFSEEERIKRNAEIRSRFVISKYPPKKEEPITQSTLSEDEVKILNKIAVEPGLPLEQIKVTLGLNNSQWALAIKRLIDEEKYVYKKDLAHKHGGQLSTLIPSKKGFKELKDRNSPIAHKPVKGDWPHWIYCLRYLIPFAEKHGFKHKLEVSFPSYDKAVDVLLIDEKGEQYGFEVVISEDIQYCIKAAMKCSAIPGLKTVTFLFEFKTQADAFSKKMKKDDQLSLFKDKIFSKPLGEFCPWGNEET